MANTLSSLLDHSEEAYGWTADLEKSLNVALGRNAVQQRALITALEQVAVIAGEIRAASQDATCIGRQRQNAA